MQVQEHVLRQQLGMPPVASKHDITKAGLDYMEMERQRLSAEKVCVCVCVHVRLRTCVLPVSKPQVH
jgi:hypothetical protein